MHSEKKHVLTLAIPLRRSDMDGAGHVNNVRYFRFMEEARVAWYESRDVVGNVPGMASPSKVLPLNCSPVIVTANCTFIKGLKFPGDALVDVSIGEPGRSSLMIWYTFRASYAPDTVFAEGVTKALWIDIVKEKSIPLPGPVRALFAPT
ncbi:MAG TPA: thioesterase family protein [Burkholderiales bacterium]|nr:thioesterase family protein [Burkholderiales bacterium]